MSEPSSPDPARIIQWPHPIWFCLPSPPYTDTVQGSLTPRNVQTYSFLGLSANRQLAFDWKLDGLKKLVFKICHRSHHMPCEAISRIFVFLQIKITRPFNYHGFHLTKEANSFIQGDHIFVRTVCFVNHRNNQSKGGFRIQCRRGRRPSKVERETNVRFCQIFQKSAWNRENFGP